MQRDCPLGLPEAMAEDSKNWMDAQSSVLSTPLPPLIIFSSTILIILMLSSVGMHFFSAISALFWSIKLTSKGKGPLPPGSLGLPIFGESFPVVFDLTSFLESRHAKYGPIWKSSIIGETVFLQAPACNKLLFANESNLVRMSWSSTILKLLGKDAIGLKVGDAYRRSRRFILPLLSKPSALAEYIPRIEGKVGTHLAELWHPSVGPGAHKDQEELGEFQLAIHDSMSRVAFCIIADLILSLDSSDPKTEELRHLFVLWTKGIPTLPVYVPGTAYYRAFKAREGILTILDRLMAKRRVELEEAKATGTQDFLSYYLTEPDDLGVFSSDSEIKDTLLQFLFAGHSTSSHVLTLTLRSLALYPDVYDLVRREQNSIAEQKSQGEGLTKENLAAMKYTWCVIQETMRINAPVPGGFRVTLTEVDYDGFTIPKGCKMFWSSASHMDPKLFVEPTKFDPTRFEGDSRRDVLPYAYIPFGGGQRICPGNDFAKMEMLICIHYVITNYDFSLVDVDEPVYTTPFPTQKSGTLMRIRKLH